MEIKNRIDSIRDAPIELQVGGEDSSVAQEFLSTANCLYVIKDKGIYKIQLADDIDPNRTNPNIPNLNQQILNVGYENEIVAKILLTAKYLFDERNANVSPFVSSLFETCLLLTRYVLELDTMVKDLAAEITEKERAYADEKKVDNNVILPSVISLDTRLHNILFKADKIKDCLIEICRLQFSPHLQKKPRLKELEETIIQAMSAEPDLVVVWQEMSKYFELIRNARNAVEHQSSDKIILSDFKMWPDGKTYPPLVELQSSTTPIRTLPLTEFIQFIQDSIIQHAEHMLVFVRCGGLLQNNPFGEWVAEFSEEDRRHKYVRFYRSIMMGDKWRILG